MTLLQLAREGQNVAPTILVGTEAFVEFSETGRLSDITLGQILGFELETEAGDLTIRPATQRPVPGMPAPARVQRAASPVRHAVERIYRHWSDDRAVAYRLAHHFESDECLPAVIIQATTDSVLQSLVSRDARTGRSTEAFTIGGNVNNTVKDFRPEHSAMLAAVERINAKPSKVFFKDCLRPLIIRVEDQLISPKAALKALMSMHSDGQLSELDVLRQLRPEILVQASSIKFFGPLPTLRGLAASPGTASGRVILSGANVSSLHGEPKIFVASDVDNENRDLFLQCVGGIGARGDMVSHLAVMARGMGVPAVAGAGTLSIDLSSRQILVGEQVFEEGCHAFVDGFNGNVWLGPAMPLLGSMPIFRAECLPFSDWLFTVAQAAREQVSLSAMAQSERAEVLNILLAIKQLRVAIERIRNPND